jgi:nucleoid-associated protein YgaU
MQKDLKTGMLLGLALATVIALWFSTHPGLSIKARLQHRPNNQDPKNITAKPLSDVQRVSLPAEAPEVDLTVYEQPEKITTQIFHIVSKGETLSSIAEKYYGSPAQWRKILSANRKTIAQPNSLTPGTNLIIPR